MGLTYGRERAHYVGNHTIGEFLTFRATVQDEAKGFTMKLEGRMVGPWVTECKRAWLALESSLSAKKFALDLSGVTFVDESGVQLLQEIYRSTHADIITNSPLTRHFAEQAMQLKTNRKKGA
jgi:anti-anti-sigma regulatory factor